MKPERWEQLDSMFHLAVGRPPGERAGFLDEACAGDDSLRQQVEALLAAHEEAGTFIERPAIEVEAKSVAAEQKELNAGQIIGHYVIISQLGRGGMGEVYLAEDATLGRKVALKLLPVDYTRDTDRVRRFQQEARAASALNHPNIVTIHEVGQFENTNFIATEFIDGETLRQRISVDRSPTTGDSSDKSGTSLPLHEVVKIAIQTADALAAAHEAGIVHRDIKPENIMVRRRDGYIKVLDFGLAKLAESVGVAVDMEAPTKPQVKTSAGVVMGTVTYMSPEQTRGEKVDVRTDIWSLGVVLYEMVAGRAPFDRPTPSEVIASILEREPPPLTRYEREIPSELERIIRKALMKEREQRYQTAKDLLVELRHLQQRVGLDVVIARPANAASAKYVFARITRRRRDAVIAAATLILALAALLYFFYQPTKTKAIDSIAVLPFVNVSGDPNTEYLSDGISEALINSLTELQQLRVMGRGTAFRYRGPQVDALAVGRELNVRAVLSGRVRQIGDTLNIQVDLVDAATGAQLWGQEYAGNISGVLSVKQSIAQEVTEKLRLRLAGEQRQQLTKRDTTNTEAFQFYFRGRYFLSRRSADGIRKALKEFQQAIGKDPTYALAYVGLADSNVLLEQYAGTPARETLPMARAAADRALQLDDSLAEAHASLGAIEMYSWNFDEAESEFKRAIELNPNYPLAHIYYGYYLRLVRGRFDEAMVEFRRAQQLDALLPTIGANIAAIYTSKGELAAGIEEAKKVVEFNPDFPAAHLMLGNLYWKHGRYTEAIAEHEKGVQLSSRWNLNLGYLGACYAAAGNRSRALQILKELKNKYDRHEALGYHMAGIYGVLGEKDQAFAWLEKDFQAHSGTLALIGYDWIMRDALSGDPRWNDLLRRIGLPQN